jgi:hypothetical protein
MYLRMYICTCTYTNLFTRLPEDGLNNLEQEVITNKNTVKQIGNKYYIIYIYRQPKYSEKAMLHCKPVHHKDHVQCSGIQCWPSRREGGEK